MLDYPTDTFVSRFILAWRSHHHIYFIVSFCALAKRKTWQIQSAHMPAEEWLWQKLSVSKNFAVQYRARKHALRNVRKSGGASIGGGTIQDNGKYFGMPTRQDKILQLLHLTPVKRLQGDQRTGAKEPNELLSLQLRTKFGHDWPSGCPNIAR